ncbi:InlB B-repeat-containing protein [Erysipelotrichaceae bacterium OttesenSCG-928-M19]|nr:InlB B-repeat-containing protein [Erysipelotrichaceae bacterium OttesenSCG-928-M19]
MLKFKKRFLVLFALLALVVTGLTYSGVNAENVKATNNTGIVAVTVNQDGTKPDAEAVFQLEDSEGNIVKKGIKTATNGKVAIKDVAAGNYTLVQINGAKDKAMSKTSVKVVAGEINEVVVGKAIETSELSEADIATKSLEIASPDIDDMSKKVSGVQYQVVNEATNDVEVVTTNSQGVAKLDDLMPGNYSVELLKAPTGYGAVTTEAQSVDLITNASVSTNVVLDKESDIKSTVTKNARLLRAAVAEELPAGDANFELTKMWDDAGTNRYLDGATFEITHVETDTTITATTGGAAGSIKGYGVAEGTYVFKEAGTAEGYKISGKTEDTLVIADGGFEYVDFYNEVDDSAPGGTVKLVKSDVFTNEYLEGVEFKLVDANGVEVETGLVTNADGEIIVEDLPRGEYNFIETKALTGYEEDYTTEWYVFSEPDEVEPYETQVPNVLLFSDIKIVKTDSADGSLLDGASFEITGPTDANLSTYTDTKVGTTDGSGEINLTDLIPGTYVVTETVAPEGYQELEGELTFTVAKGGTEANEEWSIENTLIETYTVTYDANGAEGSVPIDGNEYLAEDEVTIAAAGDLTKANHTFGGWNTAADGSGDAYEAGATTNLSESITLYAQWTEDDKYTVTYNAGSDITSGEAPVDTTEYYADQDVTVADEGTLAKDNYTFAGWATTEGATTVEYAAGDTINLSESLSLYPVWVENGTVTITYSANGGTGEVPVDSSSPYYVDNDAIVLDQGDLSRVNYTFVEWNTAADGSGDPYVAGDSITLTTNTVLYAQWLEDAKHSIIYDGNGHNTGIPHDTVEYYIGEETAVLGVGSLVKDSHDFSGWNTEADGSGTAYLEGDMIIVTSEIKLYAQWTKAVVPVEMVTVTFDKNAADAKDGTIVKQTVTKGSSIAADGMKMGNPTRAGYNLVGWCTDSGVCATDAATLFTANTTVNGDITVYAQWVKATAPIVTPESPKTGQDPILILLTVGIGMIGVFGYGLASYRREN